MTQCKVKVASRSEARSILREIGIKPKNSKVYSRPDEGYTLYVFDVEEEIIEKLQASPGVKPDNPVYR